MRLSRLGTRSAYRHWVAVSVIVAATCAVAGSAQAAKPTQVTIRTTAICGEADGTFTASGAIEDAGTIEAIVTSPTAGPFGLTGLSLHGTEVLHGAHGTYSLRWMFVLKGTDDPNVFTEKGTWTLTDGTGLSGGSGQLTATCEFGGNEDTTFQGQVH